MQQGTKTNSRWVKSGGIALVLLAFGVIVFFGVMSRNGRIFSAVPTPTPLFDLAITPQTPIIQDLAPELPRAQKVNLLVALADGTVREFLARPEQIIQVLKSLPPGANIRIHPSNQPLRQIEKQLKQRKIDIIEIDLAPERFAMDKGSLFIQRADGHVEKIFFLQEQIVSVLQNSSNEDVLLGIRASEWMRRGQAPRPSVMPPPIITAAPSPTEGVKPYATSVRLATLPIPLTQEQALQIAWEMDTNGAAKWDKPWSLDTLAAEPDRIHVQQLTLHELEPRIGRFPDLDNQELVWKITIRGPVWLYGIGWSCKCSGVTYLVWTKTGEIFGMLSEEPILEEGVVR